MVDEIDFQLMVELQKDGKQHFTTLAKKLNVAEGTVRKRYQHLLKKNLIKIVGVPNLLNLGYDYVCIMGVHVSMPEMERVGEVLRGYKNVLYLAFVLGRYELIAVVVAKDRESLADFIMHNISTVPGIMSTETLATLKIIKGETNLMDTLQLLATPDAFLLKTKK